MSGKAAAVRCAIYTRKSTEEGLDQAFNSLDAQREACESYIASQRHEGWAALPKHYDDGGFSGGNVQRPALQELITHIAAGQVDLVVVYKIDRLTRSLADFAKMVELFDKHGISFVSVTQHFNTTTSMGRLTLNVLLSFAQFEREVTAERIRDKIAASKKKGLWVGGCVPLGYEVKDRALVVKPKEAALVRSLFTRYLALKCIRKLKEELDAKGIKSKDRTSRAGVHKPGCTFSRGALHALLRNRIFLGETQHKENHYPGLHKPIVDQKLWEAVQTQLDANRREYHVRSRVKVSNVLAGMVRAADGSSFFATHSMKGDKRYRYYWQRGSEDAKGIHTAASIPAHDLEQAVDRLWKELLRAKDLDQQLGIDEPARQRLLLRASNAFAEDWDEGSTAKRRAVFLDCQVLIHIVDGKIVLSADPKSLLATLLNEPRASSEMKEPPRLTVSMKASLFPLRNGTRILGDDAAEAEFATGQIRESILKKIALGRKWIEEIINGEIESLRAIAVREKRADGYVYDTIRAACLAPELVQKLIDGMPLRSLEAKTFQESFPVSWVEQETLLSAA
jgi:site-specific DNA recombinase